MCVFITLYTLQNAETGEWTQELGLGFDQETGEMFDYRFLANPPPPVLLPDQLHHQQTHSRQAPIPPPVHHRIHRHRRHRKSFVTLGYNPTHKLFLIPSLFFFFRITALVLLLCELILHIWAHRMNTRNTNDRIFYRSPLHLITGQFCAHCTSDVGMMKLGKIQDRRRAAKQLMGSAVVA